MGRGVAATTYRKAKTQQELLERFASLMQRHHGAMLFLFGSRAAGNARADSDYDLVAVSATFRGLPPIDRAVDRVRLWFEAGGWGERLDLHCYDPDEFNRQKSSPISFLGQAQRRGELVEIPVTA